MKIKKLFIAFALLLSFTPTFSQDAEGCKEHPMFPTRMTNYILSECKNNFDAVEFNTVAGSGKNITKEGTVTFLRYDFNTETGKQKPSCLQILRNYEAAVKKINGTTVFLNVDEALATFKIIKDGKEIAWVKIECVGNDNTDSYLLRILELEEMKQEISSEDILTALNKDGHISLYINFETGKSDIKADSQKIIDEIAEMLKANPALKISIEGHTDNVGAPAANKTLSENRAKAVMTSLISKAIDKARLSAKGWGQDKPIAGNDTEDGKAKNRRVEIVKL